MKKLKISKIMYDKTFLFNNNCYLVFTFFNLNSTVIDLLRKNLEENFNFVVPKIKKKFSITNFYLEIDIEDYFIDKQELIEFFYEEDFKFYHSAVFYNNNYLQPIFFENSFLPVENEESDSVDIEEKEEEQDHDEEEEVDDNNYEFINEIFFFNFIEIINVILHNKKIIFLFYNIIFQNKNLILYKCLQSIKQPQN